MAGARVVPIKYHDTQENLLKAFQSINGLIYPGGADIINHTLYYNSSLYMFNLAIEVILNLFYYH